MRNGLEIDGYTWCGEMMAWVGPDGALASREESHSLDEKATQYNREQTLSRLDTAAAVFEMMEGTVERKAAWLWLGEKYGLNR